MNAASPNRLGSPEEPSEQIVFREDETDINTIITSFYERCVAGRPEAVRMFIEEALVSYSGARLAQDEKSILSCLRRGMGDFRRSRRPTGSRFWRRGQSSRLLE